MKKCKVERINKNSCYCETKHWRTNQRKEAIIWIFFWTKPMTLLEKNINRKINKYSSGKRLLPGGNTINRYGRNKLLRGIQLKIWEYGMKYKGNRASISHKVWFQHVKKLLKKITTKSFEARFDSEELTWDLFLTKE